MQSEPEEGHKRSAPFVSSRASLHLLTFLTTKHGAGAIRVPSGVSPDSFRESPESHPHRGKARTYSRQGFSVRTSPAGNRPEEQVLVVDADGFVRIPVSD